MDLDKQRLTSEHNDVVTAWEELFGSVGWRLLVARFEPRMEATVGEMDSAADPHAIGRVQGQRIVLRELLGLEGIVETEIRYAADQAEPLEEV